MKKDIYGTEVEYSVINKATDGNTLGEDLGEFDTDTIVLCNSQEKEDLLQCMIHEEIHAIHGICCLTQALSNCVDQIQAELISKFLIKNYHIKMRKGSIIGKVPPEMEDLVMSHSKTKSPTKT